MSLFVSVFNCYNLSRTFPREQRQAGLFSSVTFRQLCSFLENSSRHAINYFKWINSCVWSLSSLCPLRSVFAIWPFHHSSKCVHFLHLTISRKIADTPNQDDCFIFSSFEIRKASSRQLSVFFLFGSRKAQNGHHSRMKISSQKHMKGENIPQPARSGLKGQDKPSTGFCSQM